MSNKSLKRTGPGRPETTSQSHQLSAGLSTVGQQTRVGLLTSKEVAAQLQTCLHTVRRYSKRGLLPAVTLGRRLIRYRQSDVEKFIGSALTGKGGA